MKLAHAEKGKWYSVQDFACEDQDLKARFYKLGIFPGAKIMLKRKAPIFRDPLLFQVDEAQVVMGHTEAESILVSELN